MSCHAYEGQQGVMNIQGGGGYLPQPEDRRTKLVERSVGEDINSFGI